MFNTAFTRSYETASEGVESGIKSTLIGSFILNMIMAGSLSQLLSMINSLQLIVHLPFFAVSVPANVMTIEEILVPIVMFDIFESDDLMIAADSVFGTSLAEDSEGEEIDIPD
jgi:hypothetical protein